MSSPITLSNFNSIDFNAILNLVMQQAAQPVQALQSRQSDLSAENTAYGTLATRLGALETAAAGLSTSGAVAQYAATVSDATALAASASSTAVAGNYDVVVSNLAQAQITASSSTAPDANTTAVATGGTLTIGGVAVAVTGSVTLQGLADRINATTSIPASASVVQSASGAYRLVLTSASTGLANAFTITNALTGGSGVAFTDTNSNGVSGDSSADNAVLAKDAVLTVNNISITSSSNTLTSAIPGTTLTLLHADPAKTVSVSVASDTAALTTSVKSFVSAYNSLMSFVQNQSAAAANGQTGTLAHEALLRQARIALRTAIGGTYGSGTFRHLAEVGIGFDQTGGLTLGTTLLSGALQQDRASVLTLFAGTSTSGGFTNGAFGSIQAAIDAFTQAGGFVDSAQTQLQTQISRLTKQINDMTDRLAVQRASLQQEYAAADLAMTTLKSQSGTLASMASNAGPSLLTNG